MKINNYYIKDKKAILYVNIKKPLNNDHEDNPGLVEIFEQQNTARRTLYVNQCGYDADKSKRFTATNIKSGTTFYLRKKATDEIVFTGEVNNQIGDFTTFTNNTDEEFYIECNNRKSYAFKIQNNYISSLSTPLAIKFMEMSRQDAFDIGGNTGYAWRDGHQFSFELNSLVMMYMANPSYYETLPYDVYKVDECEYTELQTQNEPNIIWLIKFGVTRYYDWCTNHAITLHAFIKGQLAYFLYLYPYITNYVTQEFYEQIRDFTIQQWSVETCNKSWYDINMNHNLFTTQEVIGTVKGQLPPGYAIVPNLMMWEVAKRDNLANAQDFFDAAYNNMNWLINDVDLNNPSYTKGQRMSEYITVHSLTYFYEMYPDLCPAGTYEKILNLAKLYISRSNNLWDYRQYQTEGDLSNATSTIWVNGETTGGLCNQPGNVAGFMGIAYSLARVITDDTINKRLKELAVSHIDHVYGRNPHGRHFCYTAKDEFDGADFNWIERYDGGLGNLGYCIGVLDGSPKEESYPYNPDADTGYTEGWVAFNTAWNMSLAYLWGENENIIDGIGLFSKST